MRPTTRSARRASRTCLRSDPAPAWRVDEGESSGDEIGEDLPLLGAATVEPGPAARAARGGCRSALAVRRAQLRPHTYPRTAPLEIGLIGLVVNVLGMVIFSLAGSRPSAELLHRFES